VTTGGCNLERLSSLGLGVDVNLLSRLDTHRWAVNALTVYEDVAVHNHLTCLCDGAREAGTQYKCVKAHF
jgi:hypothetical protein